MLFREVTPALGTMEWGGGRSKKSRSHKSHHHSHRKSKRSCGSRRKKKCW